MPAKKASTFVRGDEFAWEGEHYRVTAVEQDNEDRTILWTYCIERPLTAPIIWEREPDTELDYSGHKDLPKSSEG